jgi:hypothetical protein
MDANTQQVPGYFVWEQPGKSLVVYLSLNVVDRMTVDIMRGLGSIPKRGAEVGGVLLGSVERPSPENGYRTIVRVDDFEDVACEYARGPSYLLSESEREKLEDIVERARRNPKLHSVGYYRSHTREGALMPGDEDRDLFRRYFSNPCSVVLLVHPFATKVSTAGVFIGENGELPLEVPVEFPFRRREMTGEDAPPRRSLQERVERQDRPERPRRARDEETKLDFSTLRPPEVKKEPLAQAPPPQYSLPPSFSEPAPHPKKRGLVWLPFCFLFLVLGVALGYQSALTFSPAATGTPNANAFSLNLTAGRNGNTLTVRWDRESPAVRAAERGVLEIVDGGFSKPVPLDPAHLREGTVVYQNTTAEVTFHLVVYLNSAVTVNETVEWFQ